VNLKQLAERDGSMPGARIVEALRTVPDRHKLAK
jgi:hypothetical protein